MSSLPYWSQVELDANDNGYFLLNNKTNHKPAGTTDDPSEVLLLQSTEVVLKFLNPGKDRNSILTEDGQMEQTKGGEEEDKEADEYAAYQSLQRASDLSGRIQAALHDIQQCRHRLKASSDNNDKQADGADQQDSDDMNIDDDDDDEADGSDDEASQEDMDEDGAANDDNDDDDDEDDKTLGDETELVRMVRTLNSIRALFPHLIPILNHPKRNDRKMKIKDVKWKQRKRRAMCWILGKHVFDTTSGHWCKTMHRDIIMVLKGYMDVSLAEKVASDPQCPLEFWQSQWIPELRKRMVPKIMSPLDVLLENNSSSDGEDRRNSILENAQKCDQDLFTTENVNKETFEKRRKYRQCIDNLRDYLLKSLKKRFPKARLTMYGSCLSNLSLGGSDVDLSLWIPEAEALKDRRADMDADAYQREMKRLVYKVFHFLNNREGFQGMQPITRARVPVVKGTKLRAGNPHTPDGSIDFDICFLNDIAVANSNLLREYSLADNRVRDFMIQVKRFCKHYGVNSSPSGTISSYAWNIMCIFYLQCIGFLPNLQDPALMEKAKQMPNPKGNYWHTIDGLDTFYLRWRDVEAVWERPQMFDSTTVSLLLYGFFEFYNSRFAHGFHTISIRQGAIALSKLHGRASPFKNAKLRNFSALSIEDPFEHYESDRPHDLGSHSFNDDRILGCLMEGEKQLRRLLVNGVTEDVGAPWKQLTDEEKQNEKKAGNKPNGGKAPGGRKKGPNGQDNKNQGGGNQRQGGRNNNNNRNKGRPPQQPNNPPTENQRNDNTKEKKQPQQPNKGRQPKQPNNPPTDNHGNGNAKEKKQQPQSNNPSQPKRKNYRPRGPRKPPQEKGTTNGSKNQAKKGPANEN